MNFLGWGDLVALVEYSTAIEISTGLQKIFLSPKYDQEQFYFLFCIDISKTFWNIADDHPPPKKGVFGGGVSVERVIISGLSQPAYIDGISQLDKKIYLFEKFGFLVILTNFAIS